MRHETVNLVRKRRLALALRVLRQRLVHQVLDELIALIRDNRLRVVLNLLLAVADVFLDVLELADAESQLTDHVTVALEDLDRVPADGALGDQLLDRFLNVRESMLDRSAEDVRHFGVAMRVDLGDERLGRLDAARARVGRDADDLTVQSLADAREVDRVAVFLDDVHHVHRHHHRQSEFGQLRREVEVALDVRAVDDVQDRVGVLLDEELARDLLLEGVRRERIDARQVLDDDVLMSFQDAFLLLDGDARPVADVLVRSRERIEERVSRKRNLDRHG